MFNENFNVHAALFYYLFIFEEFVKFDPITQQQQLIDL